jgi:hypothetical protein
MTATPPPPPQIPTFNVSDLVGNFTGWWEQHTFGLFGGVLAGLFVLSVFLKTRSLSATLVAASVAAAVLYRSWALLVIALALAGLIWGIWQRSGE